MLPDFLLSAGSPISAVYDWLSNLFVVMAPIESNARSHDMIINQMLMEVIEQYVIGLSGQQLSDEKKEGFFLKLLFIEHRFPHAKEKIFKVAKRLLGEDFLNKKLNAVSTRKDLEAEESLLPGETDGLSAYATKKESLKIGALSYGATTCYISLLTSPFLALRLQYPDSLPVGIFYKMFVRPIQYAPIVAHRKLIADFTSTKFVTYDIRDTLLRYFFGGMALILWTLPNAKTIFNSIATGIDTAGTVLTDSALGIKMVAETNKISNCASSIVTTMRDKQRLSFLVLGGIIAQFVEDLQEENQELLSQLSESKKRELGTALIDCVSKLLERNSRGILSGDGLDQLRELSKLVGDLLGIDKSLDDEQLLLVANAFVADSRNILGLEPIFAQSDLSKALAQLKETNIDDYNSLDGSDQRKIQALPDSDEQKIDKILFEKRVDGALNEIGIKRKDLDTTSRTNDKAKDMGSVPKAKSYCFINIITRYRCPTFSTESLFS